MSEYTAERGLMGRSIHDCPDDRPTEAERADAVLDSLSRLQLLRALTIMLSAARNAEGEQGWLDRHMRHALCQQAQDRIDNIGAALIEDGIDRVVDLLGDEVVDILEALA